MEIVHFGSEQFARLDRPLNFLEPSGTFYEALAPLFDGEPGVFDDWMRLKSRRIE
jgi:hypothetical protein